MRKISLKDELVQLIPATQADRDVIGRMSNYYIYDISEYMAGEEGWGLSEDGTYEGGINIDAYFKDARAHPFLIRYGKKLAGFAIVDRHSDEDDTDFNMAQFFVARNFKRLGLGNAAAKRLFAMFRGRWQVAVQTRNKGARAFWKTITGEVAQGQVVRTVRGAAEGLILLRFTTG